MTTRTHTGMVPEELIKPVALSDDQRKVVAMIGSLLLRYPDENFADLAGTVRGQLDQLPAQIAERFRLFLDGAESMGTRALEMHFVETFDQRRRCSLFLSYYAVGDTRQRGAAILAFRQQLEGLGLEEISDELPDHLCVVLEAVALTSGEAHARAVEMISSHRDGIEVLRSALQAIDSIYHHVIIAICMALPKIDQDTIDRYVDLIRSGPPAEMVGIDVQHLPFPTSTPDHV
ncbi:nitrate reductase molybdenum cofactor assembly chaperone [Corynebacterium breve]|uniref:Nitrate reductase molybdenum cofactor assembly chaperone n=1 Tax=Corynebacterium breve TaxID=3049799 RepID=A0ABY8VHR1_9CORY|nr:nitrate reductase molybdenum cofactor assembly chaperone [Corynebacterium breve]WIM68617.1 nitrate reductase molybdenum cofactor assembly chaperone [Corynebacterium breve]